MHIYRVTALTIAVFAFSCSASTPYQKKGLKGGYTDLALDEAANKYEVTFLGNGYTSLDKVESYVLQRSGEVCQKKGLTGFAVNKYHRECAEAIQMMANCEQYRVKVVVTCNQGAIPTHLAAGAEPAAAETPAAETTTAEPADGAAAPPAQ